MGTIRPYLRTLLAAIVLGAIAGCSYVLVYAPDAIIAPAVEVSP